jgi:hypothetical protein
MAAEISAQVAELRGLEFKRPVTVKIADGATVATYARERMDAMQSPEQRQAAERVAKLLGLLPAEVDLEALLVDFLNSQAGGFYDPGRDTFYLLEGISADLARSIISHEFVHALEDQHFDLGSILTSRRENSDRASAAHAVLEGSALLIQNNWMSKHLTRAQMLTIAQQAGEQSREMFAAPLAVWKPMLCSYYQGLAFLQKEAEPGDALMLPLNLDNINAAFARLPESTEQVLHPDKYWVAEKQDPPQEVVLELQPSAAIALENGQSAAFRLLYQDVQGEAATALLFDLDRKRSQAELERNLIGLDYTNPAASGWDGDRLALFETEPGEHFLFWVSVWDRAQDAGEFEAALEALLPEILIAAKDAGSQDPRAHLTRSQSQVILTLATSPKALPQRVSDLLTVLVNSPDPAD